MLRTFLSSVVLLLIVSVCVTAEEKNKEKKDNKDKKKAEATITKVDAKKGTVTVKMKNKEGKEVEKTFQLTEEVRMFDSTGKAAAIDVFQSGNNVLVVEAEGKLKEMHKAKKGENPGKSTGEKKPEEKKPEKKPTEKKPGGK